MKMGWRRQRPASVARDRRSMMLNTRVDQDSLTRPLNEVEEWPQPDHHILCAIERHADWSHFHWVGPGGVMLSSGISSMSTAAPAVVFVHRGFWVRAADCEIAHHD